MEKLMCCTAGGSLKSLLELELMCTRLPNLIVNVRFLRSNDWTGNLVHSLVKLLRQALRLGFNIGMPGKGL